MTDKGIPSRCWTPRARFRARLKSGKAKGKKRGTVRGTITLPHQAKLAEIGRNLENPTQ